VNLPHFYKDRIAAFGEQEIVRTWEENGRLPYYAQGGSERAIRYIVRGRPEILVQPFKEWPEAPYLLVSPHWRIEDAAWHPGLSEKLRELGYSTTLVTAKPAKHTASWDYPTCLYFPPNGLWVYKVTR
jgi:hypothetical protein